MEAMCVPGKEKNVTQVCHLCQLHLHNNSEKAN
jgi:hypothetical protein